MTSMRPFKIIITGGKDSGQFVCVHVWATNCKELFGRLKSTILYNKTVEIRDIQRERNYSREEFLKYVTKNYLIEKAFFDSKLDFIGFYDKNNDLISNDSFTKEVELSIKYKYN
jgi:hypothetical protein